MQQVGIMSTVLSLCKSVVCLCTICGASWFACFIVTFMCFDFFLSHWGSLILTLYSDEGLINTTDDDDDDEDADGVAILTLCCCGCFCCYWMIKMIKFKTKLSINW